MAIIHVTVCAGTACVVMDGSDLVLLEEHLPEHLKGRVKVKGARCLERCHGAGGSRAPYAEVEGELVERATLEGLAARIQALLEEDA